MTDEQLDALEEKIHLEQLRLIETKYGVSAANAANYGWYTGEDFESVTVQTKVYGHAILTSVATVSNIEHTWRSL